MTAATRDEAQERIREARERLFDTLDEVQKRLRPSALAQDAVESAAHGVASVARRGARAVRSRPLALAAIAGSIGLVMARGWIGDIVAGRRGKQDQTGTPPESSKPRAKRAKKGQST